MNECIWGFLCRDYMLNAVIITLLIVIPAALLSCFLVLRGWALMGDAMSHAVFPGVIIAWLWGLPISFGAFVAGMFCAVSTGYLKDNSRIRQDTAMGIVFAGMFGVGQVIYTWKQPGIHLHSLLFGNMLGINMQDIIFTAIVTLFTIVIVAAKWKDLLLHAFDPIQAKAMGLPTKLLHYGLLVLLALSIVVALKAVGIILAISILIAPGAIAFLVTRRFVAMMLLSVAVGIIGAFGGICISVYVDSDPAATIVLVFAAIFLLALFWNSRNMAKLQQQQATEILQPLDPQQPTISASGVSQSSAAPQ